MREPTPTPPETSVSTIPPDVAQGEKPYVALSCSDWQAAEGELTKIDGAIRVLLHLVDSLEQSGATAVSYLAMQLDDHVAALNLALERGRSPRPAP